MANDLTQAIQLIQGAQPNKTTRKLGNNTYGRIDGDSVAIRLHSTDVVTFTGDNKVTLNSGGWATVTTKARMNEYLPDGYRVSQSNYEWFITLPSGEVVEFPIRRLSAFSGPKHYAVINLNTGQLEA
jgi:hypothetical protein